MRLNLASEQEDGFMRSYCLKRVEIEKMTYQGMEPRRNELLEKAKQEFKEKFSAPAKKN